MNSITAYYEDKNYLNAQYAIGVGDIVKIGRTIYYIVEIVPYNHRSRWSYIIKGSEIDPEKMEDFKEFLKTPHNLPAALVCMGNLKRHYLEKSHLNDVYIMRMAFEVLYTARSLKMEQYLQSQDSSNEIKDGSVDSCS